MPAASCRASGTAQQSRLVPSAAAASTATACTATTAATARRGSVTGCFMRWGCTTTSTRTATSARVRGRGAGSAGCGCMLPAATASCIIAAIGESAAAAAIVSSPAAAKAMAAPAVSIAPTGPRTHAEEDAVVEIPRPVKSVGRAGVWSVVIVTIGADRWNADADHNLRGSRWRKGQPC